MGWARSFPSAARAIARGLLLLWAGFWILFNVASAIAEFHQYGARSSAGHAGIALLFAALARIAWRTDLVGGGLLVFCAAAVQLAIRPAGLLALALTLPAALAGLLLIARGGTLRRQARRTPSA